MNAASESALVSLIKQRRQSLLRSRSSGNEQLIFLDNRLTPTPECILRDPILNPYDKILWQGILSIAQSENPPGVVGAGTVMPTYDDLARLVNVSRMSISTSIAALRATRWLIVDQIRGECGAKRGQLYVIAYQPWDLHYTLDIDDRYIDWLETQTEERRDRRIQRIAQAVWDTMAEDRRNGVDITLSVDPIQKTLEASKALQDRSGRFYSIGANALKALTRREAESIVGGKSVPMDARNDARLDRRDLDFTKKRRVRNSYSECANPVSNSDRITTSRSSSSNNIYKNTTTTRFATELRSLSFPPGLRRTERERIAKVLIGLLPDQPDVQQMLLDELGGRMKWGEGFKGSPGGWLKGTAQAYLRMKDEFLPNYADKYARLREREAAQKQQLAGRSRPATEAEKQRSQEALAQIRKKLTNFRSAREEPR